MLHLEFPPEFVHVAFTAALAVQGGNAGGLLGKLNIDSQDFVSDISAVTNSDLPQLPA